MGVAWNGSSSDVEGFIDRHGLTFSNVHDTDGSIFGSFRVSGQPAWVFQGSGGDREIVLGALSDAELDSRLGGLSTPS